MKKYNWSTICKDSELESQNMTCPWVSEKMRCILWKCLFLTCCFFKGRRMWACMPHCQVLPSSAMILKKKIICMFPFTMHLSLSLHVKAHALLTLFVLAFQVNPAYSRCIFTSISLFLPLHFFSLECCLLPSLLSRSVCLLSSPELPYNCKSTSLGCNTKYMPFYQGLLCKSF